MHSTKETALEIDCNWNIMPINFSGVVYVKLEKRYHWYLNGQLHREDGPAVEYISGLKQWYLNGKPYSKEEWFEKLTTDEQKDKALFNMDNW